jgi:hypothetical protein
MIHFGHHLQEQHPQGQPARESSTSGLDASPGLPIDLGAALSVPRIEVSPESVVLTKDLAQAIQRLSQGACAAYSFLSDEREGTLVEPREIEALVKAAGQGRLKGNYQTVRTELEDLFGACMPSGRGDAMLGDVVRHLRMLKPFLSEDQFIVDLFSGQSSGRFHVDGAHGLGSAIRLIRVYSGLPTEYIEPKDVEPMFSAYQEQARGVGVRDILVPGASIKKIPSGATVAVRLHDDYQGIRGWVHRSPALQEKRLLMTVTGPAIFP